LPSIEKVVAMDLGNYRRANVSNLPSDSHFFDAGLRLMMSYQHEMAAKCFLACLSESPYAALAHGLMALCHSPNYNFKGEAYYISACHFDDVYLEDLQCIFPSQQVADRHSLVGVEIVEDLKRKHRKKKNASKRVGKRGSTKDTHNDDNNIDSHADMISDVEAHFLSAIRVLTCAPGVDPDLANETVGRPYADAMRKVHQKYPKDPDIAYFFAESLMVLNAWQLYEYPSGKPFSPDVVEIRNVLERALPLHPHHAGLCHMYVHLSEMSAHPEKALVACKTLRTEFPHAGHLIHMPTHIDVLIGDYESVVRYNIDAAHADRGVMEWSPATAGKESFYFGYIVHNYHMAAYGAILGAMETKAMELAAELNQIVNEDMFQELPSLTSYLESYAALEVHIMVRFGRWNELLNLEVPKDKNLMLYRTASILYGRSLAFAMIGKFAEAKKEADRFDSLRNNHAEVHERILHNNTVADLCELNRVPRSEPYKISHIFVLSFHIVAVDAVMIRGEIAYREGKHHDGLALLRRAVELQDNLNYDEPWGKMQPIRHALGGLLLEQGYLEEAIDVFRKDLKYHPKNPWALVGLIESLKQRLQENESCCATSKEIEELKEQLIAQRQSEWADYGVLVACECCQHP
jgi:tetratricopeptide (TPR) repeat protein